METDLDTVAQDVKREIARFGDDHKKLREDFMKELTEARSTLESKADAATITKSFEAVTLKYEEIDKRQQQEKASFERRLDEIQTAINRGPRTAIELPKGLSTQALEFKHARLALRGETVNPLVDYDAVEQRDLDLAEAYIKAFPRYLRCKDERLLSEDQFKALTEGSDPGVGYLVTPAVSARVMSIVFETSPMAQLAYVETIGTDKLEIPSDEGEAGAGWVGEEEARVETTAPPVGGQTIIVHELYAKPRATQRLLEDASFNVEDWLARKVGDKFSRLEATAFINGNGVKKPRGLLSYPTTTNVGTRAGGGNIQYFPGGNASVYTANAIKNLPLLALKEAYHANARWLMKRATLAALAILRDDSGASAGTGQYLWSPGLRDNSILSQLVGYPLSLADDMPAVASNSLSVAFGDFRQAYTIVRRLGMTTLRDPYSAKPYVEFYSRQRVGGDVTNFESYVLLKVSTT